AVISGFLLTAVPNWTGRLPIVGAKLLALFALWAAGRAAVMFSGLIGAALAAAVDLLFLAALGATVAREVVAGGSTRNLKVLVLLTVLLAGNAISHAELLYSARSSYGLYVGLAAILMLIILIGGRIIPSFTRNWLVRQGPGRLPRPFDHFDQLAMAIAGAALAMWIAASEAAVTAACAGGAAAADVLRFWLWAAGRSWRRPHGGVF